MSSHLVIFQTIEPRKKIQKIVPKYNIYNQEREDQRLLQSCFKTTCIVFYNNIYSIFPWIFAGKSRFMLVEAY